MMKKYILKNNIGEVGGLIKDISVEISDYLDEANINLFSVALYEVCINAIEHGNLGIDYETKQKWLESGMYQKNLSELLKTDRAKNTFTEIELGIEKDCIVLNVKDQGKGFKPLEKEEDIKKESLMRNNGRGTIMIKSYFDDVKYNYIGNTITLLKKIQ